MQLVLALGRRPENMINAPHSDRVSRWRALPLIRRQDTGAPLPMSAGKVFIGAPAPAARQAAPRSIR